MQPSFLAGDQTANNKGVNWPSMTLEPTSCQGSYIWMGGSDPMAMKGWCQVLFLSFMSGPRRLTDL